jgi:hypothetical protein
MERSRRAVYTNDKGGKEGAGAGASFHVNRHANLASMYMDQERWKEAEELGEQVMKMREMVLGQDHPDTLTSMTYLAFTLKFRGRRDEAVALMVKCIDLRKAKLGIHDPDTLSSIETLERWKAE